MTAEVMEFVHNVKLVKFTERLLEDKDRSCSPRRAPAAKKGYLYPLAEEYLGKNTRAELEALADKGLLEREFYGRELSCPKCGSINLILRLHCPKCNSENISKRPMVEHVTCGHVGPEDEFEGEKCPKCGKTLKQIGVDYVKQGVMHSCRDCKEIFQTAVEKLKCGNDETIFDKADIAELVLYFYKPTKTLEDEVNRALNQRKYIALKLEELGFKTVSPAIEKGKSGVKQQFYMIAMSGMGFMKVKVVIDMLGGDTEISPNDMFTLYGRAADVGAYGLLVAAIPRLSEEARGVADTYGIAYVEAHDLQTAVDGVVKKFAELVEAPEEKMMHVLAGSGWKKSGE